VALDLPLLKVLILIHNRIQTLKMEIYNGFHMLKTLNLSFNDITYLNSLHNLELDISHNKIAATETDAFQNLPQLEKLILDYNEIINLQPLSFRKIPNLRELNFKHNKITSLLPQLDCKFNILRTYLYLHGNTVQVPEPNKKNEPQRIANSGFES